MSPVKKSAFAAIVFTILAVLAFFYWGRETICSQFGLIVAIGVVLIIVFPAFMLGIGGPVQAKIIVLMTGPVSVFFFTWAIICYYHFGS